MTDLPARPDLDQLRHQAKDLLRAAQAGSPAAVARIRAVSDRMTLADAQLAVAREYGSASWPQLKAEVAARTMDLAREADAFVEASIGDWTGKAARMLADTPQLLELMGRDKKAVSGLTFVLDGAGGVETVTGIAAADVEGALKEIA